jgi:hypothetical protein
MKGIRDISIMSEIADEENKRICRHYTYEHEHAGSSKVMSVVCTVLHPAPTPFYIWLMFKNL